MNGACRAAVVAAAMTLTRGALAADPGPHPALPSWARFKVRMVDAADKREGNHLTGLPLFNYDTNTGFGFGAGAYYTMNGTRRSPLFDYTPYRHRLFAQVFLTTGGYQQHMVSYDGVNLGDTPYRVRAGVMFERNTSANYFGVGEATLAPLSFGGVRYATFDAQDAAASAVQPSGIASPLYDHYEYERPQAWATLERDLAGGRVRVLYGAAAQYVAVTTYDSQRTQGIAPGGGSVDAVQGPTKLGEDCAAGVVRGCDGGFNDYLKAGVAFDTRDFEPDPRSGVFVDVTGEWSARAFGSAYDYLRLTGAARAYWSPFPRLADVVLAGRFVWSMQTAGAPFYAMNVLGMTEDDQAGLGGENTLRGFKQDRFVGPVMALANVEVRWTFTRFRLWTERFSLQIAPFFDVGRVFDRVDKLSLSQWKADGGGALRIAWNQSTIIRVELGVSHEDTGFTIDFGTPF